MRELAPSMQGRLLGGPTMTITQMLSDALARAVAFLPNLFAAIVILAVGFLIASLLGRLTRRALEAVGLERRPRIRQFIGHERSLSRLPYTAGRVVYWVVGIITLGVAIDALHLTWLSAGVAVVLGYLPNILAAALIVGVGYLIGNFVYRRISESASISPIWGRVARIAVLAVAGFMAVHQLGIAPAIVTTAFTLCLGALAVAAAVAFGLGNRELAGRITQDWYERSNLPYRSAGRRDFFGEEPLDSRH
jgi:hypothetical protein